jgi:Cu(I)-responsive transcriptional regulator
MSLTPGRRFIAFSIFTAQAPQSIPSIRNFNGLAVAMASPRQARHDDPYGPCSNYRVKGMADGFLAIGELARRTDTKVETVRYYERIGLLAAPARTAGNYRAYGPEHLNRLSFIRRSRDLGFSLDQVRALLDLADQRDRSCEAVDAIAKEHRAEVDRKIADLRALRRELDSMIDQCRCGTVAECRIIDALSP